MAVICTNDYFDSNAAGIKIHYMKWEDKDVTPKAICLIAHGVAEHISRFDGIAEYLAKEGYVCYGEDHIGHGESAPTRDLMGTLPAGADEDIVKDMHKLRDIAVAENPGLPEVIIGHSMGSFVAKLYCAAYGDELKGAVYCGSGDFFNWLRKIKKPFGMLVKLIGRNRQVKVSNNMLTTAWLSRSKKNREIYLADELMTYNYTPGLIEVLGFLAADSAGPIWAEKVRKDLPILVVAGTQDIVGFCGIGVKNADKAMKETGHTDVTTKWYKGYRHELFRDDCAPEVYADVLAFLNRVLG